MDVFTTQSGIENFNFKKGKEKNKHFAGYPGKTHTDRARAGFSILLSGHLALGLEKQ